MQLKVEEGELQSNSLLLVKDIEAKAAIYPDTYTH